MTLTASQIRCLIALLALSQSGEAIASKDAAKLLGVTRPSVHKLLDILGREGMVEKSPYGAVHLTPPGRDLAQRLAQRREELMLLFARQYRLPPDECSLAATQLMSGLKEDSLRALETADAREGTVSIASSPLSQG